MKGDTGEKEKRDLSSTAQMATVIKRARLDGSQEPVTPSGRSHG